MSKSFKVIGIGAGGSNLVHYLGQHLNFHEQGSVVTLIDGDVFKSENRQNQRFKELGNKAEIKKRELRDEFSNVRFRAITEHINEENVSDLIEDGDMIFLTVDNHKTRSFVNAHCKSLDSVVLINGGLEDTEGDVSIYIRKDSRDVTPDLTYRHPEIAEPEDKAPYEKSCDEVISGNSARLITVLAVMDWMMITFANYLEGRIDYYELYFDTSTCKVRKIPIPETF
jgi:molybdopterin/thiamine biosynthesis adenylyltransferase